MCLAHAYALFPRPIGSATSAAMQRTRRLRHPRVACLPALHATVHTTLATITLTFQWSPGLSCPGKQRMSGAWAQVRIRARSRWNACSERLARVHTHQACVTVHSHSHQDQSFTHTHRITHRTTVELLYRTTISNNYIEQLYRTTVSNDYIEQLYRTSMRTRVGIVLRTPFYKPEMRKPN